MDAITAFGADEVIISTLPRRLSRWMHLDLPSKVRGMGLLGALTGGDSGPAIVSGKSADSPLIHLHVAIFRSGTPLTDPVVHLAGGPGSSSLGVASYMFNRGLGSILNQRDFILFDQRGTGRSTPDLNCPEVEQAVLDGYAAAASWARTSRRRRGGASRTWRPSASPGRTSSSGC